MMLAPPNSRVFVTIYREVILGHPRSVARLAREERTPASLHARSSYGPATHSLAKCMHACQSMTRHQPIARRTSISVVVESLLSVFACVESRSRNKSLLSLLLVS